MKALSTMDMRFLIIPLILFAQGAIAAPPPTPSCPAPLEFAERREQLLSELQETKNSATGLFLTRHLVAIYTTAPNRRAQDMLNAGIDMRRLADLDGATAALDALIAYCPGFAEGYHQRAMVRRDFGDLTGALDDLNAALDLAPDHLGAMARKAQVLSALGQYREAETMRAAVLTLNPWMPDRFLTLDIPGTAL